MESMHLAGTLSGFIASSVLSLIETLRGYPSYRWVKKISLVPLTWSYFDIFHRFTRLLALDLFLSHQFYLYDRQIFSNFILSKLKSPLLDIGSFKVNGQTHGRTPGRTYGGTYVRKNGRTDAQINFSTSVASLHIKRFLIFVLWRLVLTDLTDGGYLTRFIYFWKAY